MAGGERECKKKPWSFAGCTAGGSFVAHVGDACGPCPGTSSVPGFGRQPSTGSFSKPCSHCSGPQQGREESFTSWDSPSKELQPPSFSRGRRKEARQGICFAAARAAGQGESRMQAMDRRGKETEHTPWAQGHGSVFSS